VRKNANFLLSDNNQSAQYGRDLFVLECSSCHGANGYRSMKSRVVGWDADFAADMLSHIHMLKMAMPRFAGNDEDRAALGKYLASLNPPVNYGPITAANKLQVGEQVFAVRCGHCHTVNGKFRPLRGVFENAPPDQVSAMFPVLDSMSPNMPKFAAPEDQAQALAEYISHEANRPLTATEKPEARLPGVK
jgi:mono/diheme cytochrome c family protein